MDETLPVGDQPATAGDRLRLAREVAGLSLADVAARTRVPLRQLTAVEQGRYGDLPSPTYAVGFSKAYARVVGADEVAIAAAVRDEITRVGIRPAEYAPYQLPDPAKVPSRGLAILGAGAALAVLVLLGLWYGTDLFRTGPASSRAPVAEPTIAAAPSVAATPATPPANAAGQVRLTANDEVWLRVYDADNKTLFLGVMKPGDHFDVPANAREPMINVGRPDKLAVTLDGRPVPPLGKGDHAIKDVKVSGTAIAARLAAAPAQAVQTPTPTSTSTSTPTPTPTPAGSGSSDEASARHEPRERPRPTPTRHPALTETQRANLDAARHPPAAIGNSTP